jgi:hypothetical protein
VSLLVSQLPGRPGIFNYGTCPKDVPFGNGFRCAAGPLVRLGPPVVPYGGVASRVVDVSMSSFGPGSYDFQFWFRDVAGAVSVMVAAAWTGSVMQRFVGGLAPLSPWTGFGG